MGEVGKEPKPLRIIFCGNEFPGAEIFTRESLKKYAHLQVSSLVSGFGRDILEVFLFTSGMGASLWEGYVRQCALLFFVFGEIGTEWLGLVEVGGQIQIGQFWIPIPLVTGIFFVYLVYSFLLETPLIQRWVRCRVAAVLASGMGASLLESYICQWGVAFFHFEEIGTGCLGLVIFVIPKEAVKNYSQSFQS